jgi:CheY-like chemotaxis protein
VNVHPLLRKILLERRDAIRASELRVALELNAHPAEVSSEQGTLEAMFSRALDDVISTASRGARLVIRTSTPDLSRSTLLLYIGSGEQKFESLFETPFEERSADASGLACVVSSASSEPRRTVLLVDDDPDTVELLRRALERRGYAVLTAGGLQQAVSLGQSQPFDVLVSDLHLADGTGVDLMDALGRPPCAIAVSGASSNDDFKRVLAAGYRKLLTKPVTLTMIEAAISELLSL